MPNAACLTVTTECHDDGDVVNRFMAKFNLCITETTNWIGGSAFKGVIY